MRETLSTRWRGQAGRAEIWYTTITDPATGTGIWLHHELTAPTDGAAPIAHGLVGVFPPGEPPVLRRFDPTRWQTPHPPAVYHRPDIVMTDSSFAGSAGDVSWNMTWQDPTSTLYTFPRWAWERGLLPTTQIVPAPSARHDGEVRVGDRLWRFDAAPGATGHIYGRGMAQRWAWLHADLGNGDVLEIVAAVAKHRGWRSLPTLPLLRLRLDGQDLSAADPLIGALRLRSTIELPRWRVAGRLDRYRIAVNVHQPADRTISVPLTDPDGSVCTCHNSEVADAEILLEQRREGAWHTARHWRLQGTAHAEVGMR
ncbi:hypothetical protein ACFQO7_34000 [Catellatospora aurea]|uniref:Tocopherol cyclase-like protein n=1 Tax=Catellatospora aurea TaxID=1337874 RepID=A0ABW2H5E8_9ACTN